MFETNIISYADFSEEDIKQNNDKKYIEKVKEFCNVDFHIDSEIIQKNKKTYLRVYIVKGKY